ncbi:hypothetical protein L3Q82_015247, partial [Scortum barcoo]
MVSSQSTFSFKITLNEKPATRLRILSNVASLFDLLGFMAPFLLLGKKILQKMCQKGVGWDEPLPEELKPQWESWLNDLQNLQSIRIPRCFIPEDLAKVQRVELHHFSDASSYGYGQCTYIRVVTEDKVHCSLVMSKARVAPSKVVAKARADSRSSFLSIKHSLKFFLTGSTGLPNFPEFVGTIMIDDIQTGYCNISKKKIEPKQDWMKEFLENNPQQLEYYTQQCFEIGPNFFKDRMSSVKQSLNQTG